MDENDNINRFSNETKCIDVSKIAIREPSSFDEKMNFHRTDDNNLLKPCDNTSLVQSDHSYDTVIENPLHDCQGMETTTLSFQNKPPTPGVLHPPTVFNPNFNNKKVFDWWATQVSDSDDENWFVPRFSKRRIASTVHTFQKPQFAVAKSDKIPPASDKNAEEFCDIDLSFNARKFDTGNETTQKKGWSNFTSKLLPTRERRHKKSNERLNEVVSSDDDNSAAHSSNSKLYLPPFQMVGRIDEPEDQTLTNLSRQRKSRGKAYSKLSKSNSENFSKPMPATLLVSSRTSESTGSTFSTSSSSTLKPVETLGSIDNEVRGEQNFESAEIRAGTNAGGRPSIGSLSYSSSAASPPYVHVPDQIRDFHPNSKEEDSDSSWVMQTSSRRLVRCTKDSAAIARRRSLVESLLGSIYPRRRHASDMSKSCCPNRGRGCKRQLSGEDISSCDSSRRNSSADFRKLNFHENNPMSPAHCHSGLETDQNAFSQSPDNGKSDLGNRQMSLNNFSDISDWCDCSWCLERAPSANSWLADDSEDTGTLTEYSTTSDLDWKRRSACEALAIKPKRKQKLWSNSVQELQVMVSSYRAGLAGLGARLVKELRRRDRSLHIHRQRCDMITALLHALSLKRRQDTRMRFSVVPAPGDSGFCQWHSAMTMCARLPEGIPPEFRKRLWLTLAEHQLRARQIDWPEVERRCFNERTNPDDDELGDQIVKDLHRTGCSLFSGEDAAANQAMLKRVLLAYSRWNKSVGYCQGFNMLAAIILEEVDKNEADALKVMIYLIEGVLPESYFANNLRGLSVDMAVFRDLLRMRLPTLSRHLDYLRQGAADSSTGTCYEPPLTNVFTMQWFLTLFSNCLPKETVMRVWDLTFLQGNEVLLRSALAIWDRLAPRILAVQSADEFYTEMGGLTREMLANPNTIPPNTLVQSIVGMAPFPLPGLSELRDRYAYNITPWTLPVPSVSSVSSVSSAARRGLRLLYDDEDESEDDDDDSTNEKMAIAAAFGLSGIFRKSSNDASCPRTSTSKIAQPEPSSRPNLDISALKKQYARLRERQKQAHVILAGRSQGNFSSQNSQILGPNLRRASVDFKVGGTSSNSKAPSNDAKPLTMNHLLRGKTALTSKTKRVVARGLVVVPPVAKKIDRRRRATNISPHHPQPPIVYPYPPSLQPLLARAQQPPLGRPPPTADPDLPIPPSVQSRLAAAGHPCPPVAGLETATTAVPETLLWKDAHRRRRASLPCGVKLLEGTGRTSSLPDTVGEEGSSMESPSESTSTELCDDDDIKEVPDLPVDTATIPRADTATIPRAEAPVEDTGGDVHSSSSEPYECSREVLERLKNKDKIQTENNASVNQNSVPPSEAQCNENELPKIPEKPYAEFSSGIKANSFRKDEVINVINEVKARKRSKEMNAVILLNQNVKEGNELSNVNDITRVTTDLITVCGNYNLQMNQKVENQDIQATDSSTVHPNAQESQEILVMDHALALEPNQKDPKPELKILDELNGESDFVSQQAEYQPVLPKFDVTLQSAANSDDHDVMDEKKEDSTMPLSVKLVKNDTIVPDSVTLTEISTVSKLSSNNPNSTVSTTDEFENVKNKDLWEARDLLAETENNSSFSLEVKKDGASISGENQSETNSKKSPSLSELSHASDNSPCKSDFKSGPPQMSTSLSEAWANLANLSLESPKLSQQSPITLSRSSSISKRSRSSSSISPRSPRISLYEDDSSVFELCKEAESIRQYIDSEFLSNLLLKGEREKLEKKKTQESQLRETNPSSEKSVLSESHTLGEPIIEKNKLKHSEVKSTSDVLHYASFGTNENTENNSILVEPNEEITVSEIAAVRKEILASGSEEIDQSHSHEVSSSLGNTTPTVVKLDGHEVEAVNLERSRFVPTIKAKSDPNSPQGRDPSPLPNLVEFPVSHLHPLSAQDFGLVEVASPAISPSPSPTFSRSSFALNSQFLRSLSVSTQELLNSLVVSSSFHQEEPLSPALDESVPEKELPNSKEIELALPTLAPSTSRAICKLFNAAGEICPSQNIESLTMPLENLNVSSNGVIETTRNEKSESWKKDSVGNECVGEFKIQTIKDLPPVEAVSNCASYMHGIVDEDILRHERALDEILAPNSLDEMPLLYSQAPQSLQRTKFADNCREVPTLQELASASLPSAHPVSSAIISFNSDDHRLVERTHLKRRFNSPEFRNTQSPRLSLRDKFERDLRSKPRAKHSKSLSKNARFQKGPKSRVNSQENVEKANKLDKSKSESRIGESASAISDEYPSDERIRSDDSLECKKQTTVKFAPLNIEIPHYREPEIEEPPLDDRSSDVEDFMSPSDEITAEMIRKRLWAGLRSFSVDVDILQAYGILTNSGESFQSGLLCSLSENPTNENDTELQKVGPNTLRKTSMTAEDVEFLETRRNTKRRGSVAALQELVKENTLVIDRILKQKKNDKENKKMNASDERLAATETVEGENYEIGKKTSRILDEALILTSQDIRGRLLSMDSKSSESAVSPCNVEHIDTPPTVINEVERTVDKKVISQAVGEANIDSSEGEKYIKLSMSPVRKLQGQHEDLKSTADHEENSKTLSPCKNDQLVHSSVVTLKSKDNIETTLVPETSKPVLESDPGKENEFSPRLSKSLIVTQHEGLESDSGCFKLPLSAFCVSSSTSQTRVTESDTIVPLSANLIVGESKLKILPANKGIVSTDPDSPCRSGLDGRVRLNSAQDLPESRAQHSLTVGKECSKSESSSEGTRNDYQETIVNHASIKLRDKSQDTNKEQASLSTGEKFVSDDSEGFCEKTKFSNKSPRRSEDVGDTLSSKSSEESSFVSTISDDSSSRQSSTTSSSQKLYLPLSPPKSKPLVPIIAQSEKRSPTWSKISSPSTEHNMEPRSRPITFNPFPPRTTSLHRKEVSLKLGLYSPVSK